MLDIFAVEFVYGIGILVYILVKSLFMSFMVKRSTLMYVHLYVVFMILPYMLKQVETDIF